VTRRLAEAITAPERSIVIALQSHTSAEDQPSTRP